MKFTVARNILRESLNTVKEALPARTSLPVLSNVLVQSVAGKKTGVWLAATDLTTTLRVWMPVTKLTAGSMMLPGKSILDLARVLADAPVEITLAEDAADIKCGKGSYTLMAPAAENFPDLPDVDFKTAFTVQASDLISMVNATCFATSKEVSRLILNGILWKLDKKNMTMVATDGHRLAQMVVPVSGSKVPEQSLLVGAIAFKKLVHLIPDSGDVLVATSGNYVGFRSKRMELYTRQLEGTYPDYQRVIPPDGLHKATVSVKALSTAVKRMSVVAQDPTRRVQLDFHRSKKSVGLSVMTPDIGTGSDVAKIEHFEGDSIGIAFNAGYLLEALSNMPGPQAVLHLEHSLRAAKLVPTENMDYLVVVMPLGVMR